jgi:hypothetical protein
MLAQLVPLRANDPLALGRERPAPPPDPSPYDEAHDRAHHARSIVDEPTGADIDAKNKEEGFFTIEQVREAVLQNSIKGSQNSRGEVLVLDPELLMLIDMRFPGKVFIVEDNVYTREGLMEAYAFPEFGVAPETVFAQQEIGVFPSSRHSMKGELTYVARDVGDETVSFVMIEDLVARAARKNHSDQRAPLRVAQTKIYIGRERWEDFQQMTRFFRGAARTAHTRMLTAGAGAGTSQPVPLFDLARMLGGGGPAPLALEDEGAAARREAAAQEREEALRRREEELRLREEAARLQAAEVSARLAADMARIEKMFETLAGKKTAATPVAPTSACMRASEPAAAEDSVLL